MMKKSVAGGIGIGLIATMPAVLLAGFSYARHYSSESACSPSTISAGQMNIVVANVGMRTHELIILPLAPNQRVGSRVVGPAGRVDESKSVGEVSNNCASGSGEGIAAGSRGWTTMILTPGRYEFICNLPNHYLAGMYQEVLVI